MKLKMLAKKYSAGIILTKSIKKPHKKPTKDQHTSNMFKQQKPFRPNFNPFLCGFCFGIFDVAWKLSPPSSPWPQVTTLPSFKIAAKANAEHCSWRTSWRGCTAYMQPPVSSDVAPLNIVTKMVTKSNDCWSWSWIGPNFCNSLEIAIYGQHRNRFENNRKMKNRCSKQEVKASWCLQHLPSETKATGSKVKWKKTNATHNSSTLPVKFLEQLQIQFAAKFTCQVWVSECPHVTTVPSCRRAAKLKWFPLSLRTCCPSRFWTLELSPPKREWPHVSTCSFERTS